MCLEQLFIATKKCLFLKLVTLLKIVHDWPPEQWVFSGECFQIFWQIMAPEGFNRHGLCGSCTMYAVDRAHLSHKRPCRHSGWVMDYLRTGTKWEPMPACGLGKETGFAGSFFFIYFAWFEKEIVSLHVSCVCVASARQSKAALQTNLSKFVGKWVQNINSSGGEISVK